MPLINRSGRGYGKSTNSQITDVNAKYTSLLLSGETPSPAYNRDASLNALDIIQSGARASNFNPYQEGYYSNYFDGTGDYLSIPSSAAFAFGSGVDFTVEGWVYLTSYSPGTIAGGALIGTTNGATTGWFVNVGQDINTLRITSNASGSWTDNITVTSGNGIPLNTWTHIAFVRSGGSLVLYKNGISVASMSGASAYNFTSPNNSAYVGYFSDGSNARNITGYISNVRVVKGTAIYTSAFTPSASPLTAITNTSLLTCQSNRFVDNSSNYSTITKNGDTAVSSATPFGIPTTASYNTLYSTSFDGTGDYLSAPANAAFQLTGDFTVEAWVYMTTINSYNMIFGADNGASSDYFGIRSTTIELAISNAAYPAWSFTFATGVWYHVAVTRNSNTLKAFVNGTELTLASGSATNSSQYFQSSVAMLLGRYGNTSTPHYFTGNISNARIVKGTALYTSAFTPSTAPLTAISGTSLLTCQNATLFDNSTNNFAITSFGQSQPIPVSPFARTTGSTTVTNLGSSFFQTKTNYLAVYPTRSLTTFAGDFTAEAWVYPADTSIQYWGIFDSRQSGASAEPMIFNLNPLASPVAGSYRMTYYNGTSYYGTTTILSYVWTHVAWVRVGSTLTFYVNGVAGGTATVSGTQTGTATTNPVWIGSKDNGLNGYGSVGYIADFRLVNGTAVYTNNFYPPVNSIGYTANTAILTLQTSQPADNNTFLDSSSLYSPITRVGNPVSTNLSPFGDNWSYYFDGTGDYLSVASSTQFALSGDYTLELWVYSTVPWGASTNFVNMNSGGFFLNYTSSSGVQIGVAGVTATATFATTLTINTWNHIVVSRSSTSTKCFVNGRQVGSTSNDNTSYAQNGMYIGALWEGSQPLTGYISNLRLVKGTGLYSSNFTTPTTPLTTSANTSLLTGASNRIVDNSQALSITKNGEVKVTKFSPFDKFTKTTKSYSCVFNGSSTRLTVNNSPDLDLSTQNTNFTIEAWIYPTLLSTQQHIVQKDGISGSRQAQYAIWLTSSNELKTTISTAVGGGGNQELISNKQLQFNKWSHVAFVRHNNTISLFLDGELVAGPTAVTIIMNNNTGPLTIGYNTSSADHFRGLISNLRIVKRSLYTSSFVPQTFALTPVSGTVLLTCQSPDIIDNSPNNFRIFSQNDKMVVSNPFGDTISAKPRSYSANLYGGATYFDGAGDYLAVNENPIQRLSNAFTIQGWFNATSQIAANIAIVSKGAVATGWEIGVGRANTLLFTNATVALASTTPIKFNEWNHFAVVRENTGNRTRLYLNGNLEVTGTITNPYNETSNIYIGSGRVAGANVFTGYIAGIQMDNAALYTSNSLITPTIAVTRTANTVFYLENNPGIIDYTETASVETVGDHKLIQASPFSHSGIYSNYFDGSSDYLTGPSNYQLITTGQFTIECWVYAISIGSSQTIFENSHWDIGQNGGFRVRINTSGYIVLDASTGTFNTYPTVTTSSSGIVAKRWSHVAITRDGSNSVRVFVNGALVNTPTTYASSLSLSSDGSIGQLKVGVIIADGGQYEPFKGYISDLRVIQGNALYTAAFNVPTAPLTAITGTRFLTCQSNLFRDNSPNAFTITKIGDVSYSNFIPPYTPIYPVDTIGSSLQFDGNGDYIRLPVGSDNFNFGTSNFTVEFWMYPGFVTANEYEIVEAQTLNAFTIYKRAASLGLNFRPYANTDVLILADSNIVANAWTHIAVSRSNSYTTAWVNGTKVANTFDLTTYVAPTTPITIGARNGGTNAFTGYIRDFKVTKGVGKYESNGWVLPNRIITNKPFVYSPTIDTANNTITIDYLAAGGGGAGGYGRWVSIGSANNVPGHSAGGGGGGGGVLQGNLTLTKGEIYTVTIGRGGIAAEWINQTFIPSSNTTFTGGGFDISAVGGGYGGWVNPAGAAQPGGTGGSGGGGSSTFPAGSNAALATGRPGQGIAGIAGSSGQLGGAGGSGAGQTGFVGVSAPTGTGGRGGDGANSSITGTMVMYGAGGGGGGGRWPGLPSGTGGDGGGANLPVSMVNGGGLTGRPMAGGFGMGATTNPQASNAGPGFTYGSGGGGGQAQNSIDSFYYAGNGAPGVFITKLPMSALANTTGNPNVILYDTSIVYQFTNPGTFSISSTPRINFIANVLVVSGGAGGGGLLGGGGAGGGFRNTTLQLAAGLETAVIVGAGGAGGAGFSNGTNGGNSSIRLFSNISSTGGGRGGYYTGGGATPGGAGGSGGGAGAGGSGQPGTGGAGNYLPFSPVQGFAGGNNFAQDGAGAAGGGGGASQVGSAGASNTGGKGGNGAPSLITGANVIYAGGGAGGSTPGANGGGGAGGGGAANVAGTINTGGGGGGGNGPNPGATPTWSGSSGGSGIVIVAYPDIYPQANSSPGATYSLANNNRVYSFTTSGWLTVDTYLIPPEPPPPPPPAAFVPVSASSVELLLVAGGGGGGYNAGSGGGGGGLINLSSISVVPATPYTIIVGGGGNGSTSDPTQGTNGSNSSAFGYIAVGGGGGGGGSIIGRNGGSGGGGPGPDSNPVSAGGGYGFPSPTQQGYPGGTGAGSGASRSSGGGGGAGGVGGNGTPGNIGGRGGHGANSSITGTWLSYAGGGGGGTHGPGTALGSGGGGNSGTAPGGTATSGQVNTGGGSGGGAGYSGLANTGGSGVVIVRYPTAFNYASATGATLTTNNGNIIYRFTESGTITF